MFAVDLLVETIRWTTLDGGMNAETALSCVLLIDLVQQQPAGAVSLLEQPASSSPVSSVLEVYLKKGEEPKEPSSRKKGPLDSLLSPLHTVH